MSDSPLEHSFWEIPDMYEGDYALKWSQISPDGVKVREGGSIERMSFEMAKNCLRAKERDTKTSLCSHFYIYKVITHDKALKMYETYPCSTGQGWILPHRVDLDPNGPR